MVGLILVGAGGCTRGPRVVDVEGQATRKNQPVPYLFLNFLPEQGRPSWGITDDKGHFRLEYDDQHKGALVGKHKVFVAFRPRSPQEEIDIQQGIKKLHPEQKAILEKYGDRDRSPLEVEIKEADQRIVGSPGTELEFAL